MKPFIIFAFAITMNLCVSAQQNIAVVQESPTDTIVAPDSPVVAKTTFTMGAVLGNNTSYYGQKPLDPTPYLAVAGSLKFPSGIYFTGTAYKLLNDSGSLASAGSLGAGIEVKLGNKVTADFSYNHTFYPMNSPFLQAANNNTLSGTLTYNYFLTSSFNYDYAFGDQQDMFATFSTSKFINCGNLFSKKDGFGFTPALEISAGTQRFYQTYITEKKIRDSIAGIPLLLLPGTEQTVTETTTDLKTSFDLLCYTFKLPLSYYRASYLVEAAYQLSVLSNKVESAPGSKNSFFTLSFYYQF